MLSFDLFLIVVAMFALAAWAGLAVHVVRIEHRRAEARATIAEVAEILNRDDVRRLTLPERVAHLAPAVEGATRDLLMREAAAEETPAPIADALIAYIEDRWGLAVLEREAAVHGNAQTKWRRITSLRILCRLRHAGFVELLGKAAEQKDPEVATAALSLLGGLEEPAAGEILVRALVARRHPASRIAMHIDRSPVPLADRLKPIVEERDAVVRFWAAVLLGRYADVDGIEAVLLPLTRDADPRVRKGAIESLGRLGHDEAAAAAVKLLADPVPYVRANAARALGRLERTEEAPKVAGLLGDRDWWVRFAARQALEAMGSEIWPVLASCLNHGDRFVRNGAAEVFQNLGLLDSLIVLEAASDHPSPQKIDMLRRIASAGGVRLTDSLVERAGAVVGPRIRGLLSVIGFQDVGVA
ncbi:MAG TPA: HEAT repeat domain-containing protein [Vicinamibacterales bacterium]|jgi:HEAT repeat protein|nr:HEAT repeat domain-containing protein [Vicinamibacterales bacterium]